MGMMTRGQVIMRGRISHLKQNHPSNPVEPTPETSKPPQTSQTTEQTLPNPETKASKAISTTQRNLKPLRLKHHLLLYISLNFPYLKESNCSMTSTC